MDISALTQAIPIGVLVYLALGFKAAGFLVRDELVLRLLVTVGMLLGLSFYLFRPEPIWESVVADGILAAINLWLVCVILAERTRFGLDAQERRLLDALRTVTPGQLRKLCRRASWEVMDESRTLITEGSPLSRLYYIDAERFTIVKDGLARVVDGPTFVGEIVLLRGGTASATVEVEAGTTVVSWSQDELKQMMEQSRPLKNALIARFSLDLAEKLARSVPMDRRDGLMEIETL